MEVSLWVYRVLVIAAGLFSVGAAIHLARPDGRWGARLRRRLLLGVPWGTLLTMAFVLAFYLFVQNGLANWHNPLVIPFRAWSYFYPLGIATAGIAHADAGHIIGNLLGTLVFGSLAEYAWSHFPTKRGSHSFRSLPEHPFARILAFTVGCLLVSVTTGMFGLGPVIGFSGVVFAFAGFAVVRYPITTVVLLAGSELVSLVYRSLQTPVVPGSSGVTFSSPWWAGIAIQGHALGFFVGLVLAVLLFRRRGEVAPVGRVWLGALAFTAAKGMWAVYLILGGGEFLLFRAAGLALLFVLAALVISAAHATDRSLIAAIDLSRREAAIGLLVAVLFAVAFVAVPYNLLTIEDATVDEGTASIEARDYTVIYAEGTPDRLVGAYDLPIINTTGVTSSGVIVISDERGIWWEAVSKSRLAFAGQRSVRVGGVGWSERIVANRSGWSATGGATTYKVFLRKAGDERQLAFTAENATAEPVVDGRNVTIEPTRDGFDVRVSRANETLGRVALPARNETVATGGLTFSREKTKLYAASNGTRVRVATRETYN